MKELSIYLLALTYISIWVRLFNQTFSTTEGFRYKFRWVKYIDFKPINCNLCLSFWVGIILAICLGDILYLSLPLIHLIKD